MKKVLMIVAIVAFFSASTFAGPTTSVRGLTNFVDFDGITGNWDTSQRDNEAQAWLYIDFKEHQLRYASWSFYQDKGYPKEWRAILNASGIVLGKEEFSLGNPRSQTTQIERGKVKLRNSIFIRYYEEPEEGFSLDGQFFLEPAIVTSANFYYDEYPDYDDPAKMRWSLSYSIVGKFLGDISEEEVLGDQLTGVPEPATICLLAFGGFITALRRRRS